MKFTLQLILWELLIGSLSLQATSGLPSVLKALQSCGLTQSNSDPAQILLIPGKC